MAEVRHSYLAAHFSPAEVMSSDDRDLILWLIQGWLALKIILEIVPKAEPGNPTLRRLVKTALSDENNAASDEAVECTSERRNSNPKTEEEAS